MEFIWDVVSVSLTFPFIYCMLQYVETYNLYWLALEFGTIFVLLTTQLFKVILKPYGFRRPKGARKCDILCQKGLAEDEPGMPSGHMSVATFFAVCVWVYYGKKPLSTMIYVVALFIMACARYFKRCHTLSQILAGTTYGSVCGFVFCKVFT